MSSAVDITESFKVVKQFFQSHNARLIHGLGRTIHALETFDRNKKVDR